MAAHLDREHLVAKGAFDVLASALQYQICQFKGFIIGYLGSFMEIGIGGFSFVKKPSQTEKFDHFCWRTEKTRIFILFSLHPRFN